MRATRLHRRGYLWPYKMIAALGTCLALTLMVAPGRASAAGPWYMCQGRPSSPGLGYIYPGQRTYVTLVSQAASWISDLGWSDGYTRSQVLWPDASHYGLGETKVLSAAMAAGTTFLTLDIYVHNSGMTYTSTSSNAIAAKGDGDRDVYICFEDGGDADWDDEVVHIVYPDLAQSLTSLTPHPENDFEVDVKYDDLQLAPLENPSYSAVNEAIARGIERRALDALEKYNTLLGNAGQADAVPHRVERAHVNVRGNVLPIMSLIRPPLP
jgi:hypothetical protein